MSTGKSVRKRVVEVLKTSDKPLTPREIAEIAGLNPNSVRGRLHELKKCGLVKGEGGLLALYRERLVMTGYIQMKEITQEDYEEFVKKHDKVVIEDVEIGLRKEWRINTYPP